MHHLNAALRAHSLFKREVDYIVRDDEVIIIDEFTGRMMQGRRCRMACTRPWKRRKA